MAVNEKVHFRLLACPECNHQVCWVNPRLPSYCPDCGKHIYARLRTGVSVLIDCPAWLRYENLQHDARGQADARQQ